MATFLDLSLFSFFGSVFTFILVWIIVYALLEKTKAFGEDKKGLNGIVAISIAVLVLASKFALGFVNFVVPWFLILVVVVFLILFVFRVFGVSEESFISAGKGKARMWVITIAVIILLFGLGSVFGQTALEKGTGTTSNTNGDSSNVDSGNSVGDSSDSAVTLEGESTDTPSFTTNLYNTLFHPKVLGLLFLLVVGILALVFLTER